MLVRVARFGENSWLKPSIRRSVSSSGSGRVYPSLSSWSSGNAQIHPSSTCITLQTSTVNGIGSLWSDQFGASFLLPTSVPTNVYLSPCVGFRWFDFPILSSVALASLRLFSPFCGNTGTCWPLSSRNAVARGDRFEVVCVTCGC